MSNFIDEPLISVIVPIYNCARYLRKCLDSLQNQTYKNIEIILVDDGSLDDSAQICEEYCRHNKNFYYIHQENLGVSAARNQGMAIARGEYVAFCDSDDWVDEDMYETLYGIIRETDAEIAVIDFAHVIDGIPVAVTEDKTIHCFNPREALKEMHLGHKFAGHLCNKLIKSTLLRGKKLSIEISVYEDMLFLWDVFYESNKVAFQKVCKYHYVIRNSSATHSFNDKTWSLLKAIDMIYEKTQTYAPELIAYAQGTALGGQAFFLKLLYKSKQLSRQNYKRVVERTKRYYFKDALKLFPLNKRLFINISHKHYLIFIFIMRLAAIRRKLRRR